MYSFGDIKLLNYFTMPPNLETKLNKLLAKKETYFNKIQLLYDLSRDLNNPEYLAKFKIQMHTLDETLALFKQTIDTINDVSLDINPDYKLNYQPLEMIDTLYCHIKEAAQILEYQQVSQNIQTADQPAVARLQKIEIPEFSGDPKRWPMFFETFKSLVHNNKNLDNTSKIHYLLGALKGRALDVCAGVLPTAANYIILWETLVGKYQDKRLLADTYFSQMLEFKTAPHESAACLNNFLEKFDTSVNAIKQLKIPDLTDFFIASLALSKLDSQTRKLFEMSKHSEIPTYQEIVEFVKNQRKALSSLSKTSQTSSTKLSVSSNGAYRSKSVPQSFVTNNSSGGNKKPYKSLAGNCTICKQLHSIFQCSDFLRLTPHERYSLAKEKKLCLNCLSSIHKISDCKSTNVCNICRSRHHSLLHFDKSCSVNNNNDRENISSSSQTPSNEMSENLSTHNFCSTSSGEISQDNCTTLLSTAVVNIMSDSGEYKPARFLIDNGSQAHFITTKCCQRLKLPFRKSHSSVNGIGGPQTVLGHLNFVLSSRFDSNIQYQIYALVIDKITDRLPTTNISVKSLNYLNHIQLADDKFYQPSKIDGIIGASLFLHILGTSKVVGPPNLPMAVQTSLGYIVMGNIPTTTKTPIQNSQTFCAIVEPSLEQILHKFWEVEEIPAPSVINQEDAECENIFRTTTTRDETGRFTVALPFKEYPPVLGNSFDIARKRFYYLENKFKNDPFFKNNYSEVIKDYITQGHMTLVSPVLNDQVNSNAYYIPHFAVLKNSVSTPVRIVFDASAKTSNSRSLNDVLYSGPKLQTDIFKILLNFRLFEVAMIADIRQMYRNIRVCPEYRKFQRILWRFGPEEPLKIYELTTVVFGLKSSPFAALRTIKQLASDEAERFPFASKVVETDLYIDDLVVSVPTTPQAIELYRQIVGLFSAGSFELVKWSTNSRDLLQKIPKNIRFSSTVEFSETPEINCSLKVLGLQWDPSTDSFSFAINIPNKICTKRNILSTLARIWDPLGFLSAITFVAKLLIKELWISKVDWDVEPPVNIKKQWLQFYEELPLLSQFQVPRCIGASDNNSCATLIGFADSSLMGYGAIVYVKLIAPNNNIKVNFMCAKAKVAPMKICTIARLELCAAVLLAKLIKSIIDTSSSRIKIDNVFALSDSTVVLHWINSSPHRWKTFVANRVAKIQESVPSAKWYHVESENNIADCLSRGLTPSLLIQHSTWLSGPPWLKLDPDKWPIQPVVESNSPITEEKVIVVLPTVVDENNPLRNLMLKMSSWSKLCRITVYVLRFLKLLPIRKIISALDLEKAELVLIKIVQKIHFGKEFELLQNEQLCCKSLRHLNPFIDNGCIRVGGRLANAQISYRTKHPLLLPKKDHLVNILIDHFHRLYLHTGPHLLLSLLRQRFWILAARNIVRNRIKLCNYCFKFKPKAIFSQMADLPTSRVTEVKCFLNCGVDYAGPVYITLGRRRGIKSQKAYICLFVCLATKALHLELASDMSTDTFLGCFKRFIARRGPVCSISSDCGKNFIGAKAELDQIYNLVQSSEYIRTIGAELSSHKIEWKFNPPSAPHFGGIWEANIKSVKTHLYKAVGNQILTFEEFTTILTQIEALLNSRPLCWLSSDPSEPEALTPAHFLTLTPLKSLPAIDFSDINPNLLSRKQLLDQVVQSFWKRWRVEYLSSLQSRQKWNTPACPVTKGTLVLIQQENIPPLQWPLGIIEEVFPGKDGVVRVALVRAKNTTYKRPIVKLCPLPNQ